MFEEALLAIPEEGNARLLVMLCDALGSADAESVMLFSEGTEMTSLDEKEGQHPSRVCAQSHP